ncbi:MAG: ATP-dependent DNA helicase RecG [Erysipelotrichaceae bacterium]|nr:ATP-dependent DNA helicase RecG [Erysipelotrichaceae bacterium]
MISTPRLTPKKKELLESMQIIDGMDILLHYPFRYEVIENKPFEQWQVDDKVVFEGVLASSMKLVRYAKNRSITRFTVLTEHDLYEISIFNRPWLKKISIGTKLTIYGKYEGRQKVVATTINEQPLQEQLGIHPIYHLREGLSQKYFEELVKESWKLNKDEIIEFIPENYRKRYRLYTKKEALYHLHFPSKMNEVQQAVRTMKYEEFLRFQIVMQARRCQNKQYELGSCKKFEQEKVWKLANQLPFKLTNDQRKAIEHILQDLASDSVMYRLVQGDVGCGKTMVAMFGMYGCVLAGYQAALMAPTEILAKQHAENLKKFFQSTSVRVGILYSSLNAKEKQEVYQQLSEHQIDILVGTHALFQQQVHFAKLGMIVTDEQQRFGVQQRQALAQKGDKVDVLMMSATPIPRTLATSLYGDMDVSTIIEVPKGKKEIQTYLIKENSIRSIQKRLEELMDEGNQIYMVCASVEKNEDFSARNVQDLYQNLSKAWQGKYRVGFIHGKLKSEQKDEIIDCFLKKEFDCLVTTTVIEVGVDVKDANVMVIYDAHRFGLSQLHQLRGRVGRSAKQGYCYLLTSSKDEESLKRLQLLVDHSDGFEISQCDLKLRGPGDLLGYRQSGIPTFVLADFISDQKILNQSRDDASEILNRLECYPLIQQYLIENAKNYINYFD